jgi:hypothetical protein
MTPMLISRKSLLASLLLASTACIMPARRSTPEAETNGGQRRDFTDALNQPQDSFHIEVTASARPELGTQGKFGISCTTADSSHQRKIRVGGRGSSSDVPCTPRGLEPMEEGLPAVSYRLSLTPYYIGLLGLERSVDPAMEINSSSDPRPPYVMQLGFVRAGDLVEVHWGPP